MESWTELKSISENGYITNNIDVEARRRRRKIKTRSNIKTFSPLSFLLLRRLALRRRQVPYSDPILLHFNLIHLCLRYSFSIFWSEILTDSIMIKNVLGYGKMQRIGIYLRVFSRRTPHRFFSSFFSNSFLFHVSLVADFLIYGRVLMIYD